MAKRIVHDIDFKKEGAHVALVSKGANGQEVLLMKNKTELKKAEEVRITTSMQTFLTTFFHMWNEDAEELAEILGYEPQEWSYETIGDDTSIELLKSLDSDTSISKELYDNIEKMSKEFNVKLTKQKEKIMAKKEDQTEVVDVEKSIKDAVEAALEKERTEIADLKKSLEAKDVEVQELRKAAEKKEKDEMVELCKGYSFVEDTDKLAETLFLCKGISGFNVILETLEKARTALKETLEKELGTDEKNETIKKSDNSENVNKTSELLKKRYVKEIK